MRSYQNLKISRRLGIYIAVFVVLTVIMGYASTVSMPQSEAISLYQQISSISPTTLGIYENNIKVALIEFVPGFGPIYGVLSAYDTGLIVSATGQIPNATTTGPESFVILLLTPIFWMEFSCYALAVEESISIIVSLVKKDFLKEEWKWLFGSLLFVAAVLLISARLESSMINFLK
jgi:uncharacterized membrane protein SpoIIM required for sporulation